MASLRIVHHVIVQQQLNQHIVLEDSRLPCAIREDHYSQSILNAALPRPSVYASICPVHFTVASLDVMLVATAVVAA